MGIHVTFLLTEEIYLNKPFFPLKVVSTKQERQGLWVGLMVKGEEWISM